MHLARLAMGALFARGIAKKIQNTPHGEKPEVVNNLITNAGMMSGHPVIGAIAGNVVGEGIKKLADPAVRSRVDNLAEAALGLVSNEGTRNALRSGYRKTISALSEGKPGQASEIPTPITTPVGENPTPPIPKSYRK